ncbi:MAG TPA: amidohydrolase family protein [Steroidobacteraceae bacterium]|nr:amidohydrolase family protein [Steroidobacteraceae bacterium]
MRIVIRNARVLTLDAADTEHACATVIIEDGVIQALHTHAVAPGAVGSADRDIDASGLLVMPGLINGHFHSSVNHLKGALDSLPLEIFMLYESPAGAQAAAPRTAYVRTMLAAMEMLRSGTTAVLDDAFFVPAPSPPVIDAVMQAYADSGIRAVLALDQPDVPELGKYPYLAQLLPPHLRQAASAAPPMDAAGLLECYRHLIDRWHDSEGGRLRAAVSCSAPQRVTPEYFRALDALSLEHQLPLYMHVLETKVQRVFGEDCLDGRSLVRYVHELGLLSERSNIIHGIWLDEQDLDLIAAAGSVIAHNPISNLRLGSGIMPFRAMRERGIRICLGTDEAITDDAVNMWNVMKLTGLVHNITHPDYLTWPGAREVLECAIGGGARAMRPPRPLGQVSPGHQADLVLIDLDTLPFTPLNDLRRQLVYCENGSSVYMTLVQGRIVFENGRVTTVNEADVRAEARELVRGAGVALGPGGYDAEEWLPYYRQMYLSAAARDVGLTRWAGSAVPPGKGELT